MKRLFTTIVFAICCNVQLMAQNCMLVRDSVTDGSRETSYLDFVYDSQERLVLINFIDSASTTVDRYDSIIYNADNEIAKIQKGYVYQSQYYLQDTVTYTYTGGKLTKICTVGNINNTSNLWKLVHDISYDGNGNMSSILVDTAATIGNPEGFSGSYINLVWQNGNVTSVDLLLENDTIEVSVSYDTKPNTIKYARTDFGGGALLESVVKNHIKKVVFLKNETFGNAGTVAVDKTFTYDSNDYIATMTQNPAVFESKYFVKKYMFNGNCTSLNLKKQTTVETKVYPNPVQEIVYIESASNCNFQLKNIWGQTVVSKEINGSDNLSLGSFPAGVYLYTIQSSEGTQSGKLMLTE